MMHDVARSHGIENANRAVASLKERAVPAEVDTSLRGALTSGGWPGPLVRELADEVGGIDALERLDDVAHPDEAFDWLVVSPIEHAFVADVLELVDARPLYLGGFLSLAHPIDNELRTICRRLLHEVIARDERALRRRSTSPQSTAAALVWLALAGNGFIGRGRRQLTSELVWSRFEVPPAVNRARALLAATGLSQEAARGRQERAGKRRSADIVLPEPRFLHSRHRANLIARRTSLETYVARSARERADQQRVTDLGDGRIMLRTEPITPRFAVKVAAETGRALVVVGAGEEGAEPNLLALTIPDTRELITMLEGALAVPPRPPANSARG